MITDGDTSRSNSATASALVRSTHRTSVDGIRSADLRLAGTSRSVATTCLPSTISCRTVSEPTRPNAPVISTVSAVIGAAPSHRLAGIIAGVHGALRYTGRGICRLFGYSGRDYGQRCGTGGGFHLVEQIGVVGQALGHRLLGGEQRPVAEIAGGLVDREVVVQIQALDGQRLQRRLREPEPEMQPLPTEHRRAHRGAGDPQPRQTLSTS